MPKPFKKFNKSFSRDGPRRSSHPSRDERRSTRPTGNGPRPRSGGFSRDSRPSIPRREGGFSRPRPFGGDRDSRPPRREGGFSRDSRPPRREGFSRGGFKGDRSRDYRPRDAYDADFKLKRGVGRRAELLARAREQTKAALSEKGASLGQAVKAVDDLDSTKSLLHERLVEWFSASFPELRLDNEESYLRIAATFGARSELEQHSLAEIVGDERAKQILSLAENSTGADFAEAEKQAVRELASLVLRLFEERSQLEAYVSEEANRVMPNMCQLIEPLVAARLLSAAGSLKSLAEMPSSTIQVIGAEKSLFKHLRSHGRTPSPKHGIIFQASIIRGSPEEVRGKLARSLAAKLAIAVKADAFTGNNIAPKLKADFDKRCNEVLGKR